MTVPSAVNAAPPITATPRAADRPAPDTVDTAPASITGASAGDGGVRQVKVVVSVRFAVSLATMVTVLVVLVVGVPVMRPVVVLRVSPTGSPDAVQV